MHARIYAYDGGREEPTTGVSADLRHIESRDSVLSDMSNLPPTPRGKRIHAQSIIYDYLKRAGSEGMSVNDLAALLYHEVTEKTRTRVKVALKRLRDAGYIETTPVRHRLKSEHRLPSK